MQLIEGVSRREPVWGAPPSKQTEARSMGTLAGSALCARAAMSVESTPPLRRISTVAGLNRLCAVPCRESSPLPGGDAAAVPCSESSVAGGSAEALLRCGLKSMQWHRNRTASCSACRTALSAEPGPASSCKSCSGNGGELSVTLADTSQTVGLTPMPQLAAMGGLVFKGEESP